jgi:SAM-dependent methyltransferase
MGEDRGAPFDYEQRLARESERWAHLDEDHSAHPTWLDSPLILRQINRVVTGDENLDWTEAIQRVYLPPTRWGGRGLTLGCNDGRAERYVVQAGICSSFDAFDISEKSIEAARTSAAEAGLQLHYEVADVNTLELPRDTYSLALAVMALHHFERLEHVFAQVHAALRRDGIFVFNEFVGPTRFRWTAEQIGLANQVRAELPDELRRTPDGGLAGDVGRPDPVEFDRTDPFEAIRSADILPLAREHFRILDRRDYGGTVLQLVLDGILQNFDESREEHAAILKGLVEKERAWIESGVIPSDYTVVVAARRDASL